MVETPLLDEALGWNVVEVLVLEPAALRAVIEQNKAHGQFRYFIERFFAPAPEDEGVWPDGFWQAERVSGLYDSLARTVKAVRSIPSMT